MENKKDKEPKKKKSLGKIIGTTIKVLFITLIILGLTAGGILFGLVLSIVKEAPDIDPTRVNASLDLTSTIYDADGNLIEKIQAPEFRTIVKLNRIPKHLKDAFIAIEDERFESHMGVDPRGILSSALDNLRAGYTVRGASTITQQLVRNVYLTDLERGWDKKIKEGYLALEMEKHLTKEQILEAYLNRINLGRGAYGVQEASQTYFSKNVEDLTIAEAALFAGIVKSPTKYSPYHAISIEDFDSSRHEEVGRLEILGEKYVAVYNHEAVERQHVILGKMLELEKISQYEYDTAMRQDIKASLVPGQKKIEGISSYFTDYVKTQTVDALMHRYGYSKEQAQDMLFTGGLKIYSTIDVDLQKELEDIYKNFTEILVGDPEKIKNPILIDWRVNKDKNVVDDKNNVIYYLEENIFNENYDLVIENGTYEFRDGDLFIKNKKLNPYPKHIDITDSYIIDDKKNFVTFTIGSIVVPEDDYSILENKEIRIAGNYLRSHDDFHRLDGEGNLLISDKYFFRQTDGIVQPQSATSVIDYTTGHIKGLIGGRDIEGTSILNRATASQRQPGSAMKPIAAYLPALDNGFTAASPIDDLPFYDGKGVLWPRNWYKDRYRGLQTLRRSVEQSGNINSVKTVEAIGVQTSFKYLERMGIINPMDPGRDSIVTAAENRVSNDENLSAMGLGGMTKGLTPLELTAAYGSIANGGIYIEPISFTRIEDSNGNIIIDNIPKQNEVVSPQVAYIMGDILRTTVSSGIAGRAKLNDYVVAGKTGTTSNEVDIWFVGFTPYYVTGVWIGNDSPKVTLSQGSTIAAQFWQHIMTRLHEGKEPINTFPKPDGIVSASVCSISGKKPTELCSRDPRGSQVRSEIFAPGTLPTESCDYHIELTIDKVNGKIANEFCPEENLEARVFVQRPIAYNPEEHNGLLPTDYQFEAPKEICNDHDEFTVIPDEEDSWFPWFPWFPGEDDDSEPDNDLYEPEVEDEDFENND